MSSRPPPPRQVPTLTEVVDQQRAVPAPAARVPAPASAPTGAAPAGAIDEEALVQRVLSDLQRQVDLMLEYRLREVVTPALARMTDALVQETRHELAGVLRDVVAKAVSQELARHRVR